MRVEARCCRCRYHSPTNTTEPRQCRVQNGRSPWRHDTPQVHSVPCHHPTISKVHCYSKALGCYLLIAKSIRNVRTISCRIYLSYLVLVCETLDLKRHESPDTFIMTLLITYPAIHVITCCSRRQGRLGSCYPTI